jgi:RimJ/RimL family protein N-acetyltransferase
MRLIPIGADGTPAEKVPLDETATSICEAMAALHQRLGYAMPWVGYLAERDGALIGTCGFKSAPENGRVEIAYGTFAGNEGKGVATEMARRLIEITRETAPDVIPYAQTLPEVNASTSILRKLGFRHLGTVHHPEDGDVWEWELLELGQNPLGT